MPTSERVANEYGLGGEPELMAGIGFGKYSSRQVLNKLDPGSTMLAETPSTTELPVAWATLSRRCRMR